MIGLTEHRKLLQHGITEISLRAEHVAGIVVDEESKD